MITIKSWGFEDGIVNDTYGGKRLVIYEQYRCSIHCHKKKDEVLMVSSGLVWFESGSEPQKLAGMWLKDNQRVRVKPGTWHRFTSMRDSCIIEFSTHHEDEDSYRQTEGGKVGEENFRALMAEYYKFENQERILTPVQAGVLAESERKLGKQVGFVNGCFDLMHLGHVEYLKQARLRCDVLFVAVNSDEGIQALKGKNRPFIDEDGRLGMVESCRYVDYVVLCEGKTCLDAVAEIKPEIYIKTVEHGATGPEAAEVVKNGGKIFVVEMLKGYNTTIIANNVKAKA
jgi:rfaE bifunctional protein nucleotidyltransferase chain/domain